MTTPENFSLVSMATGGLCLGLGFGWLWWQEFRLQTELRHASEWPQVTGEMLRAAVGRGTRSPRYENGPAVAYSLPLVWYRYEFSGRTYVGWRVFAGAMPRETSHAQIALYIARNPPGSRIRVSVNPRDPRIAVLTPVAAHFSSEALLPGIFLLLLTIGSFLVALLALNAAGHLGP